MKKWIWLLTLAIILLSSFSVLEAGADYFGKTYFDSTDFQNELGSFEDSLIALELTSLDNEPPEAVTQEEIEEHRSRMGSLSEQIRSIQDQYNPDIEEAAANDNGSMEKILIKERDNKIEEIRGYFSDDDVVKEKIIEERKSNLERMKNEMTADRLAFAENYSYFTYELTNLDSRKTFSKGETINNPQFERKYTLGNPLVMSSEAYFDEAGVRLPLSDAQFEGAIQIDRTLLAASPRGDQFEQFTFTKYLLFLLAGAAISGIVLLLTKLRFRKEWFTEMEAYQNWGKLPLEIRLFLFLLTVLLALPYASTNFISTIQYSWSENLLEFGSWLVWDFARAILFLMLGVLQAIWLWAYYRNWIKLENDVKGSFTFQSLQMANKAFLEKSIGVQMLILLTIIFFWGMGTMLVIFIRAAIIV